MQVTPINYEELADQAKTEILSNDLPEDVSKSLIDVVNAMVDLQSNRSYTYSGRSEFALHLSDVPQEVYNEFGKISYLLNSNPSHLFNILMEKALTKEEFIFSAKDLKDHFPSHITHIQHLKSIKVTNKDLEEVDSVKFSHIHHLYFDHNVDTELFRKKVDKIAYCHNLYVPEHIPRLLLLTKSPFCNNFHLQ